LIAPSRSDNRSICSPMTRPRHCREALAKVWLRPPDTLRCDGVAPRLRVADAEVISGGGHIILGSSRSLSRCARSSAYEGFAAAHDAVQKPASTRRQFGLAS
jgi:hypothetical protein